LTVAHPPERRRQLNALDQAQHKIRPSVSRATRKSRVLAVVAELTQETYVTGVEVVLLIAGRLSADRERMAAGLAGGVGVVIEGIVGKNLRVRVGPDVVGSADALPGETHVLLGAKRNPHLLVAGQAKQARGITRDAVQPTYPSKAEAKFIHHVRRESVNEA